MAEERNVIITVEFKSGNTDAADQAAQKVRDIKKESQESGKEFGIMDTKLGGMWKTFSSGGQTAVKTMSTLKGAIAATGIGLLLIAVAGLVQWFKKSETGSDLLEKGMKTLGQVIRDGPIVVFNGLKTVVSALLLPIKTIISAIKMAADVLSGRSSIKEAFGEFTDTLKENTGKVVENAKAVVESGKALFENGKKAWALADELDAIDDDRRKSLKKTKELEQTIAEQRERSSDIDLTSKERLQALDVVLSSINEKYAIEEDLLERELAAKKKDLAMNADNLQMKLDVEKAENSLIDVQTAAANERRNISRQINSIEKAQTAAAKEELEKRQKLAEEALKKKLELYQKEFDQTKTLQQQVELLKLEGIERDKKALEQKYFDDLLLMYENEEAKKLLLEKYKLEYIEIEKKYAEKAAEEKIKADEKAKDDKKALDDKEKADLKTAEDAKKEIRQQGVANIASIGQSLQILAGKNKKLAIAGVMIERGAAIGEVIANTSVATAKAVKASPLTFGLPWSAINIAAGALSVAAIVKSGVDAVNQINSAKIETKALGGWVGGASHTEGGVPVVMERGEYVVNARSMAIPGIANSVIAANNAGNGNNAGSSGDMLTEERVAQIAAQVVKAVPVIADEYTSNKIGDMDRKVQARKTRFIY